MKIGKFIFALILAVLSVSRACADDGRAAHLFADEGIVSLSFAQALEKAGTISVAVLTANARVDAAAARLTQSRASFLPTIEGTASEMRQTSDLRASGLQIPLMPDPHVGPYNIFDARIRLTQTLFDAAAFDRWHAARQGQRLSAVQLLKAREDAVALIATMYVQAQRAQEHQKWMHIVLKRDRNALKVAKVSFKQGTMTLLDYSKAKAAYARGMYMYRAARAQARESRMDIATALQYPVDTHLVFEQDDQDWAINTEVPVAVSREVLVKVPVQVQSNESLDEHATGDQSNESLDVQAARRQSRESLDVQAARADVDVRKAEAAAAGTERWPRVAAVGNFGRSGESPSNGSNVFMIGLQASIPFWQGGLTQGRMAEAKARLSESELMLDDTERRAKARIIAAQEQMSAAAALIKAKDTESAVAEQQTQIARGEVRMGTGYALAIDRAAANAATISDERGAALALWHTARITLAHTLGQMFNGDTQK